MMKSVQLDEKEDSIDSKAPLLPHTHFDPKQDVLTFSHSFNPSLEGLRGIAVILTMFCHIIEEPFILREASGAMGVSIFFVLSGFLITGVLLRMQDEGRKALDLPLNTVSYRHLWRFYADRFVRLSPALIFMIGSFYCLYRYKNPDFKEIKGYCMLALMYSQNFHSLWPVDNPGPFGNMWSLACEEQYYIIWAFALPYLCRLKTKGRTLTLLSIVLTSYTIRVITSQYPNSFFGMFHWHDSLGTNLWKMILGSSIRLLPIPVKLANRGTAYLGLLILILTLCAMNGPQPFDYWSDKYGPGWRDLAAGAETWTDPLSAIAAVLIIIGVQGRNAGIFVLDNRAMRFAGKISYAWYLWQAPLLVLTGWQRYYPAFSTTAVAFVIAMVSTFLIEEPIGRRYRKFKETL